MKFEAALQEVTTESVDEEGRGITWSKVRSYLSPGWDDVPPEHEEEFILWYHESAMIKKLDSRLDKQALALSLLTTVEMAYTVFLSRAFDRTTNRHPLYAGHRFEVFFISRSVAFCLLLAWRAVAGGNSWILTAPEEVHTRLLWTYLGIATLMFVSYDALTVYPSYVDGGQLEASAAYTHFFAMLFIFVYHCVCAQLPFLFLPSCAFVVLATVITLLLRAPWAWIGSRSMFFTMATKIMFVGVACLNAFLAHNHETALRSRFKARLQMADMHYRIESILNTLMPPAVVEELRGLAPNAAPPSHWYEAATIAQSDLCGFTQLAARKQPAEVVRFLSEIFGLFDDLTDTHEVYKVETVGDAYIAGQADKPLTLKKSPLSVVLFGLDMVRATHEWSRKKGENVSCRVGVHHGSVIGGIVGEEMQRYHLFGETMTALEVLEATAPEGRVQVSEACKQAAERCMRDKLQLQAAQQQQAQQQPEGETFKRELVQFEERAEPQLRTSKGEVHEYEEVGGVTYLVRGYRGKFTSRGSLTHS